MNMLVGNENHKASRWTSLALVCGAVFVSLAVWSLAGVGRADGSLAPPQDSGNAAGADAPEAVAAAKAWLATNAIRLETVEAGHGFADLQPLKQVIGGARVVALGEATHGTREFFQLKHRMLEFLVSEMGFTVFGIEATMPEGFDVNEYVLTGRGDARKALAGLYFWTWDTEEVLAMIEWVRSYNADPAHTRKVKFYGFDMQSAPRAAKVTRAYLRRVDSRAAESAEKDLAMLANPYLESSFANLPPDEKTARWKTIKQVLSDLDRHKADYVARSSAEDWVLARQHAVVLSQYLEMQSAAIFSPGIRDRSMAENIRWILGHEGPDAKAVVWAHNGHVSGGTQSIIPMGWHLRQMYGRDLVVFGFAFNEGQFNAREMLNPMESGLKEFEVGPAPEGSLDALLASSGLRLAAVDFRRLATAGAAAKWFAVPRGSRDIGATFSARGSGALGKKNAPQVFDALLFVEKTTAARPLDAPLPEPKLPAATNLDFESGKAGEWPPGWQERPKLARFDFAIRTSRENPHRGEQCAVIRRTPGQHYGELAGNLTQRLDARPYRGMKIQFRAAARAEIAGEGSGAWVRLVISRRGINILDTRQIAFDSLTQCTVTSAEWKVFEVAAEVPRDADAITYGLYLVGDGSAWLDSVSLQEIKQ